MSKRNINQPLRVLKVDRMEILKQMKIQILDCNIIHLITELLAT